MIILLKIKTSYIQEGIYNTSQRGNFALMYVPLKLSQCFFQKRLISPLLTDLTNALLSLLQSSKVWLNSFTVEAWLQTVLKQKQQLALIWIYDKQLECMYALNSLTDLIAPAQVQTFLWQLPHLSLSCMAHPLHDRAVTNCDPPLGDMLHWEEINTSESRAAGS